MRADDKQNQFFVTCSTVEHDSYRNPSRVISFHKHSYWRTCIRCNVYVYMDKNKTSSTRRGNNFIQLGIHLASTILESHTKRANITGQAMFTTVWMTLIHSHAKSDKILFRILPQNSK